MQILPSKAPPRGNLGAPRAPKGVRGVLNFFRVPWPDPVERGRGEVNLSPGRDYKDLFIIIFNSANLLLFLIKLSY